MSENDENRGEAIAIKVPSKGGEQEESKEPQPPPGVNPEAGGKKVVLSDELSVEDRELKERLETSVTIALDPTSSQEVVLSALGMLRKEIRESTSSMTSVPKPFRFLQPHYKAVTDYYKQHNPEPKSSSSSSSASSSSSSSSSKAMQVEEGSGSSTKWSSILLAAWTDILSTLAMTMAPEGSRDCLRYRLAAPSPGETVGDWGAEYVGTLSRDIGSEYLARLESESSTADLLSLVKAIIPYNLAHNAEIDACDLCLETDSLTILLEAGVVEASIAPRICTYLLKISSYLGDVEEASVAAETAYQLFRKVGLHVDALRTALRLGGVEMVPRVTAVFAECSDSAVRRQMGYILGRHRAMGLVINDADVDALIGNAKLSGHFALLARDLEVVEPKGPEDIYKSHLAGNASARPRGAAGFLGGGDTGPVESAKSNLASTYVSAFVNAGFGTDKLMTPGDSQWVYRNKDHGQIAAVASLGLLHAWNVTQIDVLDKYLSAEEENVRAGAVLGLSLMTAGTRDLDVDPIFALLSTHVEAGTTAGHNQKLTALLGLGYSFAGTAREDVSEILTSYLTGSAKEANKSFELAAIAGLSLGLVHVGSAAEVPASDIADRLMCANSIELNAAIARHLALGLGLLFLGRGDACEAMHEILSAIDHPISSFAQTILISCAYAGTGNVLRIQQLLRTCASHYEAEDLLKADKAAKEEEERAAKAAGGGGGGGAGNASSSATVPPSAAAATEGASSSSSSAAGKSSTSSASASGAPGGGGAPSSTPPEGGGNVAGKYLNQSAAVLGLALVSMGEETSIDMATRMADHLLQYGDTSVRRAIPLALALLHVGDPDYAVIDLFSKLSHDSNEETAQSAIFALGLASAGTNNSRVAGLLRTLSIYYKNDAGHMFVVRIAQALLHMGKGLITVNPIHSDRLLLSPVALAGVLVSTCLFLDVKSTLHTVGAKWHILLFSFVLAMAPRFIMTVDEAGEPLPVEVRVGVAAETVGHAGKPRTITGAQTHTSPVLMGVRDRAELVDPEAHTSLSSVVEGVVILKTTGKVTRAKKAATASASNSSTSSGSNSSSNTSSGAK